MIDEDEKELTIQIPPGPPLGDLVVRAEGVKKGLWRHPALRRPDLQPAQGRHRRRHRPQRRGQDDALQDDRRQEKPDGGKLTVGPTVKVGARRSEPRRAERQEHDLRGDHRRHRLHHARQAEGREPRLLRPVQLQGAGSAEARRQLLRRRAEPHPPREAVAHAAATCCCSTNRPTTSTWTRSARSKMRWSTSRAARSSSRTTGGSWTASRRTFWRSRATARWSGARGTSACMKSKSTSALGPAADLPTRIKYRKLHA